MEMSPSPFELASTFGFCGYMLFILFAGGAGIYGALKARSEGAPGAGPTVVAGGFGLMIALALWSALFEGLPASVFEWGTLRQLLVMLGGMVDALATVVLIVGFVMLQPRES